ncbi:Aste57867_2229 [Aphanomyces stellatus]|uniref:Aste57867_2229 protein n=1 Tax=Aphanomyces stellatus TaxID=120398 RepID=A0A485K782_9STRA|nr:hypothetical protein As57867_002224 [Aphanomyces stellatus]VFT79432.1 Aste57867_2229 [Aphanomyces stellatus]
MDHLGAALPRFGHLRVLDISSVRIRAIEPILSFVRDSKITMLILDNAYLYDDDFSAKTEGIQQLTHWLTHNPIVHVEFCNLTFQADTSTLGRFYAALFTSPTMLSLTIEFNELPNFPTHPFAAALCMKTLDLMGSHVDADGVAHLCRGLRNSRVAKLMLDGLDAASVLEVVTVLPHTKFCDVNLHTESATTEWCLQLATCLPQTQLQDLLLSNKLDNGYVFALAHALALTPQLKSLWLCSDALGMAGTTALVRAAGARFAVTKMLSLSHNILTDEDVRELTTIVGRFDNIAKCSST